MSATVHPNLPIALAENPNVVKFAAVDGAAMVFIVDDWQNDWTNDVRGQIDEIYAETDMEFSDVVMSWETDVDIGEDYDSILVYE